MSKLSPVVLVTQSFGKASEYRRAVLAILSYYANAIDKTLTTYLFTDNFLWFEPYLRDLPIEYISLSPEKINLMRGEINFLHRMKIAMIEEAFQLSNANLLYFDSDTFFTSDPSVYLSSLSPENSFMHLFEYNFSALKNTSFEEGYKFYNLISNQKFELSNCLAFEVRADHASWNAGVMMLHLSHARFIKDVYALTNQFYPKTKNHASEQFAFSILLQENTHLQSCASVIYHYWYKVKKIIIDLFLEQNIPALSSLVLDQRLASVKSYTQTLPHYLDKHILMAKDNAIQAFNDQEFSKGVYWTIKAIGKGAYSDSIFIKDILYHIKAKIIKNKAVEKN